MRTWWCIYIAGCAAGFKVILLCIDVELRGMLDDAQFDALKLLFNMAQAHSRAQPRTDQGNPPG